MGTADGSQARTAGATAGLDAAIETAAFKAAGLAMVPFGGDDDEERYFEWHECIDQPNCHTVKYGQPCACSGIPWPSEAVQAAVRAAYPHIRRAVLNEAADDIRSRYSEIRRAEEANGIGAGRSAIHVLELAALMVEGLRERAEEGGDG